MLTDLKARQAKPDGRDYKLADGGGLYLFVTAKGYKSWRMKFRIGGKVRSPGAKVARHCLSDRFLFDGGARVRRQNIWH